jgi:hypothetical protein
MLKLTPNKDEDKKLKLNPIKNEPNFTFFITPIVETIEQDRDEIVEFVGDVRVGYGDGWEVWLDRYNIILREGSRESYYSDFESFFQALLTKRYKYHLSKESWHNMEKIIELCRRDIQDACENISKNIDFLSKKFSLNRIFSK